MNHFSSRKFILSVFVLFILFVPVVSPILAQMMTENSFLQSEMPASSPISLPSPPSTLPPGVCDNLFGAKVCVIKADGEDLGKRNCYNNNDCINVVIPPPVPKPDLGGVCTSFDDGRVKCVSQPEGENLDKRDCLVDEDCPLPKNSTPSPVINTVVPSSVVAESPTTVTIVGKGFTPESVVFVNGSALPINMVQSTERVLSVDVPRSVVSAQGTLDVKVANPGKDNQGVSNAKPIVVVEKVKINKVEPVSDELRIGSEGVAQKILNVRSAPSLTATILTKLNLGAMAIITGGPKVADGYVWYQINKGWIAVKSDAKVGSGDNQAFFIAKPSSKPITQVSDIAYAGSCSKDGKKCVKDAVYDGVNFYNKCWQLENGYNTCHIYEPEKFIKKGVCEVLTGGRKKCVFAAPYDKREPCIFTLIGVGPKGEKLDSCAVPPKIEPAKIKYKGVCEGNVCFKVPDTEDNVEVKKNCIQLDNDTSNCNPTFQAIIKEGKCKNNKCYHKDEAGYDSKGIDCYTTAKVDSCYQAYIK